MPKYPNVAVPFVSILPQISRFIDLYFISRRHAVNLFQNIGSTILSRFEVKYKQPFRKSIFINLSENSYVIYR